MAREARVEAAELVRETPAVAWHTLGVDEVVRRLDTDLDRGLSHDEAAARLERYGPNELEPPSKTPRWRLFLSQFNDVTIWVLMGAVVISVVEGQAPEAIAITFILLMNGILGFVQEYRAEQALEALKSMSAPVATVMRDGVEQDVPATGLVPGDIVLLEAGDKIPADGRLARVSALRVEEASLTGESRPTKKSTDPLENADLPLGDRDDLVFAGTSVAVGHGSNVVTETGQSTEMGRIADLLAAQEDEKTPLQRELDVVGKRLALAVVVIAALVFGVSVWQGSELTVALLIAVSLAVAAIPEGLPAVVTVSLSLGVREMAAHNAIVKRLQAVETLGATTFICSDKTGTLTKNEMTARRLLIGDDLVRVLPDWAMEPAERAPDTADCELMLEIAASCNDAHFTADGTLVGDPTETALLVAADELGRDRVRPRRVGEIPFDSERKRMTTIHAVDGSRVAYMKGGTDVVLDLCTSARIHGETVPMTDELRAALSLDNEELASSGYRTLALAWRTLGEDEPSEGEELERDMTYAGIIGLVDPPRAEVPDAIETCHRAGMEVAMVTGDHALTARAIGDEIGLSREGGVVTGVELEAMSDDELYEIVQDTRIYARVDPEHKLRIVDALKRRGHVVAMTGDGVNDAPALKKADIGVAMGIVGTDVSREAADMVLADDNFATIVLAVDMGRVAFDNLRKFILFMLSCNVSEVLIIFIATFVAGRPALLPLQILWINLVTDGLPALALGVDPPDPGVMDRPPRGADEGILVRERQWQIVWQGALITMAGLLVWGFAEYVQTDYSGSHVQTMLFTTMVLTQLLHAFDFRSATRTVWSKESLRNRWLVYAFLGSFVLQLLVIYLPFLQRLFSTEALFWQDWAAIVVAALIAVSIIDLVKVTLARRGR